MSAAHDHAIRIDPETGALLPCSCGSVPTGFEYAPTGEYRDGRRVVAPEIVWGPDPLGILLRDASERDQ